MTIGERIRQCRDKLGMSQTALADKVDSTKQNIYKYETGIITNIPSDKIEQIADALNVTPAYLMGWETQKDPLPSGFIPMPETSQVPLVGRIACGTPILVEQNIEAYVPVLTRWRADFALICEGQSMEPLFQDGDLVAIRKQASVEQGQVAAVRIGSEVTLKRVYLHQDCIELRPENSSFDSIIKFREEMNEVVIEGRAVGICRGLV